MVFRTGTITDSNPGVAIYAAIESYMISDGWVLVDTVVIGGNTHKVLKSAAAGNARNLDWYLDINYPTTGITGGIRFSVFEDYNATTHIATRGAVNGTSVTTMETTYYSRYGATGSALETNWANAATYTVMSNTLTTSSFTYYISVTRNRIIGILTNNAQNMFYAGFFTPTTQYATQAGSLLYPLIQGVYQAAAAGYYAQSGISAASASIAVTRVPKMILVNNGWGTSVYSLSIELLHSGQVGSAANTATNDITLVPMPVTLQISTGSAAAYIQNAFIGTLDGIASGYVIGTAVRGDTVTVGSDTWYMLSPQTQETLFMQAL